MDDVVRNLSKVLECVCCYEEPRPDTSTVGLCVNGHVTCEPCGTNLIETSKPCPICRQDFSVTRGNKIVSTILENVSQHMMYHCKHDHCTTRLSGDAILQHEKECSHKPISCPRNNCQFRGGIYRFLEGMHKCVTVCRVSEPTNSWRFALNINLVYSVDYNLAKISDKFKPVVLKGSADGFQSCAYINIASKNDAILIYSGWLNQKSHMSEEHQNVRVEISAYVNTKAGKIGNFVSQYPKYEEEHVRDDDDGIVLSRETLFNWSDWAYLHECQECEGKSKRSHMHIEVKMSF